MDNREPPAAVKVANVSKTFYQDSAPPVYALRSVNFEAFPNEIVMIVGPSGSGKTTLLSVIAGTLRIDKGEIDIFNTQLETLSESAITEFRKQHIGFIFQQFHLIPTLTVLENVSVPLLLQNKPLSFALEQAARELEKVGLAEKLDVYPRSLSGGQQQRVAIARALVHEPDLVICDEPTAALDGETGAKIMKLLQEVAKSRNRCVIVVTHDPRIFKYANRISKMEDGRILSEEKVPDEEYNT